MFPTIPDGPPSPIDPRIGRVPTSHDWTSVGQRGEKTFQLVGLHCVEHAVMKPAHDTLLVKDDQIGLVFVSGSVGDPLLPVRAHMMFRNVQGLWVCSDPNCSVAPGRASMPPVGALHHVPSPACGCGARVLELLYCEPCGETFLGGYRSETGNPNQWRLTPDFPDLEQVPDRASAHRNSLFYDGRKG